MGVKSLRMVQLLSLVGWLTEKAESLNIGVSGTIRKITC